MQAVVKTPHIDITIRGNIPEKLLSVLKKEYGRKVRIVDDTDTTMLRAVDTDWYKKTKASIQPGENMKLYRELHKMTQAELGEKLGGLPRQHISNMERGMQAISLATAKKLSAFFKVSVERFV
ncbi:MAG: helix-turn-helix transcriptional regulator [Proteobacteria bacterium]|nr:helix-turn-helix transcriptional regulator [Pseudomonadota bacterium]